MISVCIATYNGEKYIQEQLDSILCQLSDVDEIIISDDSSTDRTKEIIEEIKDKRIKLLADNKFYSPIYNLENAIKNAIGDYIFLSDQDDIWMSNKVEIMLEELKKVDLCVSDCELVNENGEIIHSSFFQINDSKKGFIKNLFKNSYMGCCMAFRREIIKYICPFPSNIPMHDSWIGLNVELWGDCSFIEEKLIKNRRHGENVSTTGFKSNSNKIYKVYYRFILFYQLMKRRLYIKGQN